MGGVPPLGYDIDDKKLVINEPEAETVRHIFERCVALGSVHVLQDELAMAGIVSICQPVADQTEQGQNG